MPFVMCVLPSFVQHPSSSCRSEPNNPQNVHSSPPETFNNDLDLASPYRGSHCRRCFGINHSRSPPKSSTRPLDAHHLLHPPWDWAPSRPRRSRNLFPTPDFTRPPSSRSNCLRLPTLRSARPRRLRDYESRVRCCQSLRGNRNVTE